MTNPLPEWFKVSYDHEVVEDILKMLDKFSLHTVCTEAHCPNIGECFKKNSATFMIMGKNCTRNCRFCIVSKEPVKALDPEEPKNVARAAKIMGLKHAVITSVTRDDLEDGGAAHFAQTIREVKAALPGAVEEVLIPDFRGAKESLDMITAQRPDRVSQVPDHQEQPVCGREARSESEYHQGPYPTMQDIRRFLYARRYRRRCRGAGGMSL